ncbi:MAG TPA: M55 family metallopeptidase [Nitrolancea sp.]|nr:M55 family metallopeptidase [Nitrolancea sp.]
MNIYMSVDMEGITGIVHRDMLSQEARDYERGRRLMTADAVAAVEGLAQGGATYVLVNDGHGPMRNLLFEEFRSPAVLLSGTADSKAHCQVEAADLRHYDAAVFVGYHAMARTPKAIAPHTIAGVAVAELRINGRPHGETGLNAAVLGSLGIPVVMVTGDTTLEQEAKAFLGDAIQTVAVKEPVGTAAAICRPQQETLPEIRDAARRALESRGQVKPYNPSEFRLEVDFFNVPQCDRASRVAGVERLGPLTMLVAGGSPWEQYAVLWSALRAALNAPQSWLA